MNHNLIASLSIDVKAPISKIWNALTNPELIKEYLYGTETITDWKAGSPIVFQGEYEGHKYRDHGTILENIWHKKIAYSYWSGFSGLEDKPENYGSVIYTLDQKSENLTTFTWTQKGFVDEERQQHSQGGMAEFLEQIKEIMER